MLVPFDVIVMPVEQVLLFYYLIMAEAAGIVFMFLIYLHLRVFRMGPLGKAELGNKRGELAVVRELNGLGRVVKLKQQVKGILVSKEPHLYFTGADTVTHIQNGPNAYFIESTSAEAVPPEVARIAGLLNEGKVPGIEAKDINQMALEFAEKWYYPNYLYQWSTVNLTKDQRDAFNISSPGEYQVWLQKRLADIKGALQFDIQKANELSYMREIKTGVRRTISSVDGFMGDDPDNTKVFHYEESKQVPGARVMVAQDALSPKQKNDWIIQRVYDAAQATGVAVSISAIAAWNATTPTQATVEDSNIAVEQRVRKEAGSPKASTILIVVMIIMAGALGFLVGFVV